MTPYQAGEARGRIDAVRMLDLDGYTERMRCATYLPDEESLPLNVRGRALWLGGYAKGLLDAALQAIGTEGDD